MTPTPPFVHEEGRTPFNPPLVGISFRGTGEVDATRRGSPLLIVFIRTEAMRGASPFLFVFLSAQTRRGGYPSSWCVSIHTDATRRGSVRHG